MQEISPNRFPGLLLAALTPPGPLVVLIAVAAGLAGAFTDLSSASPSAADHATAVGLTWTIAVGLGGWLVSAMARAITKTLSGLSQIFPLKRVTIGAVSSIQDLATNLLLARHRRNLTKALNTAFEALQADSSVGLAIDHVDRIIKISVAHTAPEKTTISWRSKREGLEVSIGQLDPETFVVVVTELAHSAVTYASAIEDVLDAEPFLRDAWGWVVFRRLMKTDLPSEIGEKSSSKPFDSAPADVQRATLSIEDVLRTTVKRGGLELDQFHELNMLRSKVAAATLAIVRRKVPR